MLVKTHFPEPELASRSGGRAISGGGVASRPAVTRTNVCKMQKIILNCNAGGVDSIGQFPCSMTDVK